MVDAHLHVHRCTELWWAHEEKESRFYRRRQSRDPVYRDLLDLHERIRDVQARQCLVVDRALREAHRDGFDWLLHIDADEALLLPRHRDARRFFAEVATDADQVLFRNLEAVPESPVVGDWFREVTLFKVHQALLREDPAEGTQVQSHRQEKLETWRKKRIAAGTDPDDLKDNRTFNSLMFGIRMMRREVAIGLDLGLPPVDSASEFESSEGEDEEEREEAVGGGSQEMRPPKKKTPWARDVPCYYTAYTNGKAAVRLRQGVPPPLPVGVHRCTSDSNVGLRNHKCAGEGTPVVLHYANCGFKAWKRKYQLLSTGHGTEDGGFSISRRGINSMRAHLAHRELVARGDDAALEVYYKTFIMCSEFGELPHFACHGLLARTSAVREVLGGSDFVAS